MRSRVVQLSELGGCWAAVRLGGGRCEKVLTCKYPEKEGCGAVEAELDYIKERHMGQMMRTARKISILKESPPSVASPTEAPSGVRGDKDE